MKQKQAMKDVIVVEKPLGQTPLQVIESFKRTNPSYAHERIGYAGRLDPMAEGVLVLLVGEENKNRKYYERLEKTYVFDVLFGIATDTYDQLGLITKHQQPEQSDVLEVKIQTLLPQLLGRYKQPYPPYSAVRVWGKSLFYWAREGKLDQISLPEKMIEVVSLARVEQYHLLADILQKQIDANIALVQGDFRQPAIRKRWNVFFATQKGQSFPVYRFTMTCSSGTYVRAVADTMGRAIGCGAMALAIKRTRVGSFVL